MKPQRLHDWPERMNAALRRVAVQPFAWGTHDCVTFAADVAEAMLGQDLLAPFRGRWTTEREAARVLLELGGMRAAVCSVLGPPLASHLQARRGDVVMVEQEPGRLMLAVANGSYWCAPGPHGLIVKSGCEVAAWEVGLA